MQMRLFGRSGFRVSEVGFGAWPIGSKSYGQVDESEAVAALEAYVEGGGNFIDTARGYNTSEAIIGRFLKAAGCRDQLVIASKQGGDDPDRIIEGVETSLKTMDIDVVDVYHLHSPPDDPDAMHRCLDALVKMREQGRIKATAASIKGPAVTPATQQLCRQYIESGKCDVIQLIFSIFRQANRDVFELARAHGVGLIGRTVMESGFLSGKYAVGHRFAEGDHRRRWSDETLDDLLAEAQWVTDLAATGPYTSLAEVAVRYALDEPGLSTVIVGAKDAAQTRANVGMAALPSLPAAVANQFARRYRGQDGRVNPA